MHFQNTPRKFKRLNPSFSGDYLCQAVNTWMQIQSLPVMPASNELAGVSTQGRVSVGSIGTKWVMLFSPVR